MPIYLDCNATTPMEPEVVEAVHTYMVSEFGNAGSRSHEFGTRAKQATQQARDEVASLVDTSRDEVLFTSGATESNNLAILGLAEHGLEAGRRHIVSSQIEHKAVLEPLQEMERRGFEVTLVPPTSRGWVEPTALFDAVREDTLLVSLMHVNNETGIIQPIEEVAAHLNGHEAYLHVDAAQSFGKLIPPLRNKRIDLISISAHKIHGPKGVGALVARRRGFSKPPLQPIHFGGGQERGLRPGTLPVPLIVGLGRAAMLAQRDLGERREACERFRKKLLQELIPLDPVIHGDQQRVLHNTLNLRFPGVDSEAAIIALKDIAAVSNGSACTSASYQPSHVLQAMGLNGTHIQEAIRLSWCHQTTEPDWQEMVRAINRLRCS